MKKELSEPELANCSELKKSEESNILSKVKEFTTTFGTGISIVLIQDTCKFVEFELQELLEGLHELDEDVVLRINDGVFSRTYAAELLLDLVESSKAIDLYESRITLKQ